MVSRKRAWKSRKQLSEIIMQDGYKTSFWLYEWNEETALKLNHRFCIRILKFNPGGRFLFTEQIGVRKDNWEKFVQAINQIAIE
jgi:hypothetical protein